MWLRRVLKQWIAVAAWLVGAAFAFGDGVAWVNRLSGYEFTEEQVYAGVFLLFGITVIWQLAKRQQQVDEAEQKTRLWASPSRIVQNYVSASEPPLALNEVSIDTTVRFEVWSDIDVRTAGLVLNVVGVRKSSWRRPWRVLVPKSRRKLEIRAAGRDTPAYYKQINHVDAQPFVDEARFKWRGKRAAIDWGDGFVLELALELGSPRSVLRAKVGTNLHERGAARIL